MSNQVQYEPVPESDLHEYQRFHVNKAKTEEVDPATGGIAAEALGIPAIAGAKTLKGVLGSNITKELTNRIAEKIASPAVPMEAPPKPIPTTVGEFHKPQMVSQEGFGPGAMKNVAHNVDEIVANALHKDIAQNPVKGFELEGNRRVLTPVGTSLPSSAAPQGGMVPPAMGGAAPSTPPPLSPAQRAMQVVKGAASSPIVRGANTLGGLWEGGENAVRLWNHFKQGNPGRELLDVAGLVSNAATIAPTPASPWSNIIGAGASIPIGMYQRHLEEQDKVQKKATGGLATLNPVQHFDTGGYVQAFGGAYPGALTMGGSMSPIAVASTPMAPTTPTPAPDTTAFGGAYPGALTMGGSMSPVASTTPAPIPMSSNMPLQPSPMLDASMVNPSLNLAQPQPSSMMGFGNDVKYINQLAQPIMASATQAPQRWHNQPNFSRMQTPRYNAGPAANDRQIRGRGGLLSLLSRQNRLR